MRVAISGAGYAAEFYVKALNDLGNPIVGITNRTTEKGQRLAEKAHTTFFPNLEHLISKVAPDVVIVATATESHFHDIRIAVENGVQKIFCEKPAGIDMGEIQRIGRLCEEHHTALGVGYKMRYETIFRQVKDCIDDGRIGKLSTITTNFYQAVPYSAWYLDSGFIQETMVHPIDICNWFSGSVPLQTMCIAENHLGGRREDHVSAIIQYKSGVTAQINGGWIPDYPYLPGRQNFCFQVVGTGGYICGVRPNRILMCDEKGPVSSVIEPVDPIVLELQDFFARTDQRQPLTVGIPDAVNVHRVIEAVRKSAASNTMVAS